MADVKVEIVSDDPLSEPDEDDMRHYYNDNETEIDRTKNQPLNIEKRETSTCWPNQKASAENIVKRIQLILWQLGFTISDFEFFDFQVRYLEKVIVIISSSYVFVKQQLTS